MAPDDQYIRRGKIILSISFICLFLSIGLFVYENTNFQEQKYTLTYETIDIKTMGTAKVAVKKIKKDSIFSSLVSNKEKNSTLKEISLEKSATEYPIIQTSKKEEVKKTKPVWRLPTERGYITQYAHYNHIALDITSSRGTNERIYPVADGIITSIYNDNYGAKIVTVNHNINGKYYTSQYVHLSWYASDIYVGKAVTTDTVLGGMGATGLATGIHLHLTVMDCNLYNPNDYNCSTLNKFYNYGRTRVTQGFHGLNSLMNVPYSWYSR